MDIDGDGNADVLSGSNPGEIYLFRGNADHSFAAGAMLKDKKGEIINKRPEDPSQRTTQIIGSAVAVSAADWDGDGAPDLIAGNGNGDVYLIHNEGTAKAYAFAEPQPLATTNGKAIRVSGRAGPCIADWDGDGDLDLLVGMEDGSVSLYRNIGTKTAPRLALPLQVVTPGTRSGRDQVVKEPRRAGRSKICVADWNGDGKPDLLLGDLITQKAEQREPTAEEKAQQDQIRKEMEPLMKQRSDLIAKYRSASGEEKKKLVDEITEIGQKAYALQKQLPQEYETHGWVWIFLRK